MINSYKNLFNQLIPNNGTQLVRQYFLKVKKADLFLQSNVERDGSTTYVNK